MTNCIEISRRYLGFLRAKPGRKCPGERQPHPGRGRELLRVHPSMKENELRVESLANDVSVKDCATDLMRLFSTWPPTDSALMPGIRLKSAAVPCRILGSGPVCGRPCGPSSSTATASRTRATARAHSCRHGRAFPGSPAAYFVPYFTASPPRRGAGLGLGVCPTALVKEAKGLLHVRCKPGQGTDFTVLSAS